MILGFPWKSQQQPSRVHQEITATIENQSPLRNNRQRPLFLMSNHLEPYIICSLIFKKWHGFCRARICRFIFPPAQNIPPFGSPRARYARGACVGVPPRPPHETSGTADSRSLQGPPFVERLDNPCGARAAHVCRSGQARAARLLSHRGHPVFGMSCSALVGTKPGADGVRHIASPALLWVQPVRKHAGYWGVDGSGMPRLFWDVGPGFCFGLAPSK